METFNLMSCSFLPKVNLELHLVTRGPGDTTACCAPFSLCCCATPDPKCPAWIGWGHVGSLTCRPHLTVEYRLQLNTTSVNKKLNFSMWSAKSIRAISQFPWPIECARLVTNESRFSKWKRKRGEHSLLLLQVLLPAEPNGAGWTFPIPQIFRSNHRIFFIFFFYRGLKDLRDQLAFPDQRDLL